MALSEVVAPAARRLKLDSGASLALVLLGVGCGATTNTAEIGAARSADPSGSPSIASPSAVAPQAGWWTFSSPYLGYTVNLPASLRHSHSGQPDAQLGFRGEDDFANESGVNGPLGMDEKGIVFAIMVTDDTGDRCLEHDLRGQRVDREHHLTLDGTDASLRVFTFWASGSESGPVMVLNTLHAGYCFQFVFLSWTQSVRDAYEKPAIGILESFRFGALPPFTA